MATASQVPPVSSPPRYRSVNLWAVLSLVCGVASAAMILVDWLLAPLFLVAAAIFFGWNALGQIQRLPEEYTGRWLAQAGIGLGVVLGILLSVKPFFIAEVPHGYQVLEWADLEPNKKEVVSPAALEMSDKKTKVYVRGYILPGRRQRALTEFSICRTSDQCRFAIKANRPVDLIHIELTGDRTIDYTTHSIGLGGIFHVDSDFSHGTPYTIQADYIYP